MPKKKKYSKSFFHFQKSLLRDIMPTKANKCVISAALASSYSARRKWIKASKPTCTDILNEYKHLGSYEGDMVKFKIYK